MAEQAKDMRVFVKMSMDYISRFENLRSDYFEDIAREEG